MQISEAESLVMDVLWRRHPQSAEEVIAALADSQQWQEATIKTLLNRLLNKGAVRADKDGRRYLYAPVLKREDWVMGESRSLLDRLFDGRVAPLVAHFSEQRKLSRKDIADLRQLLDELDDDAR
ncbi:penicillinase repressor family protein [Lysobacter antibioticus]|jgi:predicted transcriptional regulator|uniref:BlaI/MecI/CopY family transcriptional regulator n=1 Tax=Lysobacter antibioticus TaxID=84531 RepID=UPI0007174E05|nr:BlaI/MecI/CopY family transcriptional regulator [Lysobacter antibioticus]ALN65622.1 penicillinase repressor family protein [Lysobacter antibioticus]